LLLCGLLVFYDVIDCFSCLCIGFLDTTDNGPDAVVLIENNPSSTTMTATAETAATAASAEREEDTVSSEAPKMVHRPPEKEIIPELPSATANAFTQLV